MGSGGPSKPTEPEVHEIAISKSGPSLRHHSLPSPLLPSLPLPRPTLLVLQAGRSTLLVLPLYHLSLPSWLDLLPRSLLHRGGRGPAPSSVCRRLRPYCWVPAAARLLTLQISACRWPGPCARCRFISSGPLPEVIQRRSVCSIAWSLLASYTTESISFISTKTLGALS